MRQAATAVLLVLIASCASQSNVPDQVLGRYALVTTSGLGHLVDTYSVDRRIPFYAATVRDALVARGATVDFVNDPASSTGYDAVIVLGYSRGGISTVDPASPDASGAAVANQGTGKLRYEIQRAGKSVASGSANLSITIPDQVLDSSQNAADVTAAKNVATQIVRRLARG